MNVDEIYTELCFLRNDLNKTTERLNTLCIKLHYALYSDKDE